MDGIWTNMLLIVNAAGKLCTLNNARLLISAILWLLLKNGCQRRAM